MKIALVTPYGPSAAGGVTEHIAHLRAELVRGGHEALVLAPGARQGIAHAADGYRIGRAVPVPSNGSRAWISLDVMSARGVKALLERERFDVIHVHAPHTPLLPYLALLYSRAANVATFHAARETRTWYAAARPLLAPVLNRIDVRIAVSTAARAFAERHFGGAYEVVPNGVDLARFGPEVEPLPWADDGVPRVLFVGRFDEPRKGLADLLRAMALVQARLREVRLVVVGPGNAERAGRQARELGVKDVAFAGQVGKAELTRYYASCQVFCAPSTGYESFGIVLLEAMAAGTPVVASAIRGYADVLTHGREGLLTLPGDTDALATALTGLLSDVGRRARMGAAGRETASRYAWSRIAPRILELYDRALRGSPTRSRC